MDFSQDFNNNNSSSSSSQQPPFAEDNTINSYPSSEESDLEDLSYIYPPQVEFSINEENDDSDVSINSMGDDSDVDIIEENISVPSVPSNISVDNISLPPIPEGVKLPYQKDYIKNLKDNMSLVDLENDYNDFPRLIPDKYDSISNISLPSIPEGDDLYDEENSKFDGDSSSLETKKIEEYTNNSNDSISLPFIPKEDKLSPNPNINSNINSLKNDIKGEASSSNIINSAYNNVIHEFEKNVEKNKVDIQKSPEEIPEIYKASVRKVVEKLPNNVPEENKKIISEILKDIIDSVVVNHSNSKGTEIPYNISPSEETEYVKIYNEYQMCKQWYINKLKTPIINPYTNRSIKPHKLTYNRLEDNCRQITDTINNNPKLKEYIDKQSYKIFNSSVGKINQTISKNPEILNETNDLIDLFSNTVNDKIKSTNISPPPSHVVTKEEAKKEISNVLNNIGECVIKQAKGKEVENPSFFDDLKVYKKCKEWSVNKLVNPWTGRTIKENGPKYTELYYQCRKVQDFYHSNLEFKKYVDNNLSQCIDNVLNNVDHFLNKHPEVSQNSNLLIDVYNHNVNKVVNEENQGIPKDHKEKISQILHDTADCVIKKNQNVNYVKEFETYIKCREWYENKQKNPIINPESGRKIKFNGPTYNRLNAECYENKQMYDKDVGFKDYIKSKFNINSGTPSPYKQIKKSEVIQNLKKYSNEECDEWINNDGKINPKTKRTVDKYGRIGSSITKECEFNNDECTRWRSNPNIHPRFPNKIITPDSKIYRQLNNDCNKQLGPTISKNFTENELNEWLLNPYINPRTKKLILPGGRPFNDFYKASGKLDLKNTPECGRWREDDTINPWTNQIVNTQDIKQRLNKYCK
jgi:hypothetical protein